MQLLAMAMARWVGTGTADQNDIALLGEEAAAGEIIDQRLVDGCALELEILKILGKRQFGDGELVLDRACLLLVNLGVEQVADNTLRFVLALDGGRHDLVESGLHAVELELTHEVEQLSAFHQMISSEIVATGTVGDRGMVQCQRSRGWWGCWLAAQDRAGGPGC